MSKSTPTTTPTASDSTPSKAQPPYNSFYWSNSVEPHVIRRKQILEKHPEIKQLMGVCPTLKYILFVTVTAQLYSGYICHTFTWPVYLLVLFAFGSTINHFFMMAIHELSHNICFKHPLPNKIFSIFVNLPVLLPYAITFRGYHMQHHRYQGEDNVDVDLPTELEGRLFQSTLGKFIFFLLQAFFYVIRPIVVYPKKQSTLEIVHSIIQYAFISLWCYYLGPSGIFYFLFSTLIGTSFHPCAGHFFAEHYVFVEGYETYSYYGVLNWLTLNVGYHNEHHDFPYIPGFRLPLVRKIAPEFYDNLPQHPSWVGAQWQFILNPKLTAFSRVKRKNLTDEDKKKLD